MLMKELLDSVKTPLSEADTLPSYYSNHLYAILEQLVKILPEYARIQGDDGELSTLLSKLKLRQVKESIDSSSDDRKKTNAILKLTKNIQDIAGEQCEELEVVKKPKKKAKKVAVKKVMD